MGFSKLFNDLAVVFIVGGFIVLITSKVLKKEPKELLKSIWDWVSSAFQDGEEQTELVNK
jgi:hypothetical protein